MQIAFYKQPENCQMGRNRIYTEPMSTVTATITVQQHYWLERKAKQRQMAVWAKKELQANAAGAGLSARDMKTVKVSDILREVLAAAMAADEPNASSTQGFD
jgi:hypothetical protein